jgi:hypothetical protein
MPLVDSPLFGQDIPRSTIFSDIVEFREKDNLVSICVSLDSQEELYCPDILIQKQ